MVANEWPGFPLNAIFMTLHENEIICIDNILAGVDDLLVQLQEDH